MANLNYDIIRVEDTEANLQTTLISGQLGFTTDTNKLGHLMQDGITMQWFTSTDDSWIYWSGAGWGGVTTDSPDGKFHIWTGSAGSVSADTNMNELVLENDGDCGMTILAPDIYDCTVCFGSPSDNQGSIINWNHDDDELKIDTIGEFKLYTNDGTAALYVYDTQDALLATSLGINIGMTTAASEVLEVGGNAKIKGHIYQTDDYNDKHVWGVFNQCTITHDNTDMVLNSQEAGSGNFAFNGGNIRIDDDHYIGLDSDTDLLQLSSGTLKVNGNILVDDNGYIGLDSDTNLLQLAADTLRVYGSVKIADDTYVGNVINPNLIKLTSGSVVEVNGNIQINDNAYIGSDSDTDLLRLTTGQLRVAGNVRIADSGYIGCASDSDLLQLTSSNLEVLGDCSHNANSQKNYWGAGNDCSITYDGSNMIFNSQEVGSGDFILNGGKIGVNTATPSYPLTVYDASLSEIVTLTNNVAGFIRSDESNTDVRMGSITNHDLGFYTNDTIHMTLNTSGVLNIANLTASLPVATDASKNLVSVAKSSAYTPTNVSTDRAFDADTVAIAELADVVGTLIADLQTANILG